MIPYCLHHGIGLLPWSPQAGGSLARPVGTKTTRSEALKTTLTEADEAIVHRVAEVAEKKGWKMGQVALAWVRSKSITSPIIGASSVRLQVLCKLQVHLSLTFYLQIQRLEESVVSDKELTPEDIKFLEEPCVILFVSAGYNLTRYCLTSYVTKDVRGHS